MCTHTSDCLVTGLTYATVACTKGYCTGYLADGETCGINTDCTHTSYCDTTSKKCTKVSNTGTCYTFKDNPSGNTCEQNMGCVNGKCVPYFSADGGQPCFIWADCKSYSCDQNTLTCNHSAPVSKNKAPHTCNLANAATDCVTKAYKNFANQSVTANTNC